MKIVAPRRAARIVIGMFSFFVAGAIVYSIIPRSGASAHMNTEPAPPVQPVSLASPGRIEGVSDLLNVGAAIDGVIQKIYVKEGQLVQQGDRLAELECSDLQSALRVSKAEAESLKQGRTRLLRGSRDEERQAAAQKSAAARAVLEQASAQLTRMSKLFEAAEVSKVAYEQARRDSEVARAEFEQAQRNEELVNAGPLSEEVARADADLNAAQDRIKMAEDKLNKCVVRAPITGTVLQIHLREGESFALLAPRPLFSMADVSGRRVRAEVDEHDVGNVHIGQRILVSSEAFANRAFTGKVARLASIMGRKTVQTGNPVQKEDRDVLEVVADLEQPANALPVGLRVTVQFMR